MIAVDTTILVYSHREDSAFYTPSFKAVKKLAESGVLWSIPWPSIHENIPRRFAFSHFPLSGAWSISKSTRSTESFSS